MPRRSEPADFWKWVDRKAGRRKCWPWTGALNENGYGRVRYQGVEWKASRLAWTLTHGDPGPLCVLHKCDNPPCCNPRHLFTGTLQDNTQDMMRKGRHPRNRTGYLPTGDRHHSRLRPEVVARGEDNGSAILTEAKVRKIRQLRSEGFTMQSIAARFRVAKGTIVFIVKRETWKHVS